MIFPASIWNIYYPSLGEPRVRRVGRTQNGDLKLLETLHCADNQLICLNEPLSLHRHKMAKEFVSLSLVLPRDRFYSSHVLNTEGAYTVNQSLIRGWTSLSDSRLSYRGTKWRYTAKPISSVTSKAQPRVPIERNGEFISSTRALFNLQVVEAAAVGKWS